MGGVQSTVMGTPKPALAISSPTPEKTDNGPDYSIMRICDGNMKKFEYMLFISAETCRLSYCDVGILHQSLKAYGMSPDVLNKVISHYDAKACPTLSVGQCKKRNVLTRASFAPPPSYELTPCPGGFNNGGQQPLVRYISSPTDTTCIVVSPLALAKNDNSIILGTDCIVTFKGSSSLRNWEKNVRSLAPGDLADTIKDVVSGGPPGIMVSTSFVVPIVEIFNNILEGITVVAPNCTRIFVFGHSKGGAESELAGAMLALKFPDKEIHIISLGSPKVVAPASRDAFNKFFFEDRQGKVTLTRIESVGSIVGDVVTDIPRNMVHPGWGTATSTLDSFRQQYNITIDGKNKRNPASWPFPESIDLWDRINSSKLDEIVKGIVQEPVLAETPPADQKVGGATYFRVKGSSWTANPHMEYFGMFFWGSQRVLGMGNPAKTALVGSREAQTGSDVNKTFVANIFKDCTKYQYEPWVSKGNSLDFYNKTNMNEVGKSSFDSVLPNFQQAIRKGDTIGQSVNKNLKGVFGLRGGRRRTYRKSKRSSKKTRRDSFR